MSENIKSCKHWKFETTEDPHFADISVKLHNAVRNNSEYQGGLQTHPNFQIPYANLQISGKCWPWLTPLPPSHGFLISTENLNVTLQQFPTQDIEDLFHLLYV